MAYAQNTSTDSKKPYGDVTYADPGYQADKKKRYPLDSEEHCRAAWSYINMPKNAAKYSPAELSRIKGKIRAALKRYGAEVAEDVKASAPTQMLGVELARPGTWHLSSGKRTFVDEDLKDAADFFAASGQARIPIGFGHTDSRFDGDPAFGWVSNIRYTEDAKGPVLLGDLVDMDDWVAAAAPLRWPNRSIEGFANLDWNGRTYRLVLTRLALLGSTPPAMPTLRSLADLREAIAAAAEESAAEFVAASALDESEEDTQDPASEAVVPSTEQEAGMDPAKIRERLGLDEDEVSDDDVMEALAYAGFVPAPEPAAEPEPVAASAPPVPRPAAKPGTMVIEASAWDALQERTKALEARDALRRRDERDEIIAKAVQEGKFAPARKPHWVRLWDVDPEGTRQVIDTLAKNVMPVAASGYSSDGTELEDDELDREIARLSPPTGKVA
jgi:hypothetical protein